MPILENKNDYSEQLTYEVRLLKRKLRNGLISSTEVAEHQQALPDVSANARWLDQNGQECDADIQNEMMRLHQEGWDEIITGDGLKPRAPKEASAEAPAEEEDNIGSKSSGEAPAEENAG